MRMTVHSVIIPQILPEPGSIPGTGESAENRKARLLPARCSQSKAENKCPKAAPALTHAAKGRWKDRRTAQGAGRSHRMPALSGGGG